MSINLGSQTKVGMYVDSGIRTDVNNNTSQVSDIVYKWVTTKKYENLVSNGDWYPALEQAYSDTPIGGTLFIHDLLPISQTLVIDKQITIVTPHAEEDATKSSGLTKTANVPILKINHRGVKLVNVHVTSNIKNSGDNTQGIIIGDVGIQAQNTIFENVYATNLGGDGVLHQNGNNCDLELSVINNLGHGYKLQPLTGTDNNGSGNIVKIINAYGNAKDGVNLNSCEGNDIFVCTQSNTGYGLTLNSVWNSLIRGYSELNGSGGVNQTSNTSGNLIIGKWHDGITVPTSSGNREENPSFTNYWVEDVIGSGYQTRFVIPRFLMTPQYQPPSNPVNGEFSNNSLSGYSGERVPRVWMKEQSKGFYWRTLATREYVNTRRNGTTANRPLDVRVGSDYFDTSLNKPVWCKSATPTYVTLTINSAATKSGNITIQLNGTSFTVSVVSGDSIATIQQKIAQTWANGWYNSLSGSNAVVYESANAQDLTGTNSFTDTGTTGVTATVSKTGTGISPVWVDSAGTIV